MSDLEEFAVRSGDGDSEVELPLWRKPNPGGAPVLLLHGASANHRSFEYPGRDPDAGTPRSLVDWLHREGFDPWLLDWRGSGLVVDRVRQDSPQRLRGCFDFDHTADHDIPAALDVIAHRTGASTIHAVGHCMGAATLAQAVAAGTVGPDQGVERVVLLALGLFYEPAWDGRLKSQDHVLERVWREATQSVVDPRPDGIWHSELEEVYANWPGGLRPHPGARPDAMRTLCNRVSFMFGPPYREANVPGLHRPGFLAEQFGAIPLRMYLHGARNVRRGWAARFLGRYDDTEFIGLRGWLNFHALRSVTLMTGEDNRLWHRDSIDRMCQWLVRGPRRRRCEVVPKILRGYAHQDMLWGEKAHEQVFPTILAGLGGSPDGPVSGGSGTLRGRAREGDGRGNAGGEGGSGDRSRLGDRPRDGGAAR